MYSSYMTYKETVWENSLNSRLSGVSITGQKEWTVFTDGLHTLRSLNSQQVRLITSFCFKNSRGTKQYRKKKKPVRIPQNLKGLC